MGDKRCECCGKTMGPTASEAREGRLATRRRYCSKACGGVARRRRVTLECPTCGRSFQIYRSKGEERRFCSKACYLKDHATAVLERKCDQCGKTFFPPDYSDKRRFCSRQCFGAAKSLSMRGANNPNYGGTLYSGGWVMPGGTRVELSLSRRGDGNPNYLDGRGAGRIRHQTCIHRWATENLPRVCAGCGREATDVHHVVAQRFFPQLELSHFRQNLVWLCVRCHRAADRNARRAISEGRIHDLPFGGLLPTPIRVQLARDGSVSSLPPECDYSPLGTLASAVAARGFGTGA